MPNIERSHQLSDSHAKGSHENDPQFDCYDCWPWQNGYGAMVLASLSANTDSKPEWWHSGGGIIGIYLTHQGFTYFIGAADSPDVGMDISREGYEGENIGYGNFGSLEDHTPTEMAKRIWEGIENGVGVTRVEPEPPFDGQLESNCSMCNHEPTLNHEIHYPSGNAVVNKENNNARK